MITENHSMITKLKIQKKHKKRNRVETEINFDSKILTQIIKPDNLKRIFSKNYVFLTLERHESNFR